MSITLEKPSVIYLEQLFQKAAIDADFRDEILANPEAFGIPAGAELALPAAVEKQDQSVFELLDDALGELNIAVACRATCSFGPFTIVCDGTTK
ncbi:cinnamycin family lantibiotic [Kamptonema formosum]|uniref:cinnamycin family lantibiotic n=1 Tax=Kamptonema formosum TaxID=331992 RepID=UPI0003471892|nr:cinnamycin family lantibiotic [Oscillatoria sp. PCC 10802]